MKLTKAETQRFENGRTCTIEKYVFPSQNMGFVTAKINGRYPEKGKVLNESCDEIYFVTAGTCEVHNQDGAFSLNEGDLFFLPKGKWWWVEGNELAVVVCTAPPWTPEQHKHLNDD